MHHTRWRAVAPRWGWLISALLHAALLFVLAALLQPMDLGEVGPLVVEAMLAPDDVPPETLSGLIDDVVAEPLAFEFEHEASPLDDTAPEVPVPFSHTSRGRGRRGTRNAATRDNKARLRAWLAQVSTGSGTDRRPGSRRATTESKLAMTTKPTASPRPLPAASARWQFSLRSLLAVMLAVALLSGLSRIAAQLALFVAGAAAATVATWRFIRSIRSRRPIGKRLAAGFTLVWLAFYVVSAGPAVTVCQHGIVSELAFKIFYFPLDGLYRRTPLRRPLTWYAEFWQSGESGSALRGYL